ncbi:MAG: NACHT domain-containing protein [Methylococcales bacterium]
MPATLADLVKIRSQPAEEALAFLERTAKAAADVPIYYPDHLKPLDPGSEKFDAIRQMVQAHDRKEYNQWLAKESERQRAAGLPAEGLAYRDKRARTEDLEPDHNRGRRTTDEAPKPPPVVWEAGTGGRYRRAVILGDPGFGKSWLLRFEARHLALSQLKALADQTITVDDAVLPLWARLSDLTANNPDFDTTLLEYFCRHQSPVFRRLLEARLVPKNEILRSQPIAMDATNVRAVLLLDALDEVPESQRQVLRQRLSEFADTHPAVRILISSRLVGYTGLPLRDGNELELLPFDQNQIHQFVRVWFGENPAGRANALFDTLNTRPRLAALARIPLMLTLLCRTYQAKRDHFPNRRVELYEECLKGLLRDWNAQPQRLNLDDGYVKAVLEFLAPAAYRLREQELDQFTLTQLRDLFDEELFNLYKLKPTHEVVKRHDASSLIAELKATGILVAVGTDIDTPLLFLHRTFHEYLAACHLAGKYRIKQAPPVSWAEFAPIISKKAWLPEWQEVIVLLAGLIEDPVSLLEMLVDPNPTALNPHGDDVFRHRLALACLCLAEIEPVTREKHWDLLNQLTTQAMDVCFENAKVYSFDEVKGYFNDHFIASLPALGQCNGYWGDEPLMTGVGKKLGDDNTGTRKWALHVISKVAQAAVDADPTILYRFVDMLMDGKVGKHWEIVDIIHILYWAFFYRDNAPRSVHRNIVGRLADLLADKSRSVQMVAVRIIAKLGMVDDDPAILERFADLLDDSNMRKEVMSAISHRYLGKNISPAIISRLVDLLSDDDPDVRSDAFTPSAISVRRLLIQISSTGSSDCSRIGARSCQMRQPRSSPISAPPQSIRLSPNDSPTCSMNPQLRNRLSKPSASWAPLQLPRQLLTGFPTCS